MGRDCRLPLDPTFHLDLDRGESFGDDRFQTLRRDGCCDWLVNEGDEWPTDGEIPAAVEEVEPGLLDDTDSDNNHIREE